MKIEELIESRKSNLDLEEAHPKVWNGVATRWKRSKSRGAQYWRIAAALLLIAVIGLLIRNQQLETRVETLASLSDISAEYAAIEAGYETRIKSIESEIPIQLIQHQEEFQWMLDELKLLEEVNNLYRADIGKVNSDQLIPTLLDYYEKKIKLLQRLQLEIKRQKNHEKNETHNTTGAAV